MIFRILILLFLLFGASCVSRPPVPLPSDMDAILLNRLDHNASAFQSLKGMAKVKVVTPEKTLRANQVILAEKPDRLRAEMLSPFGQTLMVLASDGKDFKVSLPSSGDFYQGEATAANLARFTRLPFEIADLVNLLLYQVPVIPYRSFHVILQGTDHYELVLEGEDDLVQEVQFDRDLRLTQAVFVQNGHTILKVAYADFSDSQNEFPLKTSIEVPASQAEAELFFTQVTTNVAIPAQRFVLVPKAGAVIKALP